MLLNKILYPFWILAVPRSGSSRLVEFLNKTQFNLNFKEFDWNLNRIEVLANLPKHIKFQRTYFDAKGFLETDKKLILKKYPKIKFIITEREDLYEQTISTYFAECTKKWFIENNKDFEIYKKIKVPYNEKELIRLFNRNVMHKNCWNLFVKDTKFMKLRYEDSLENQKKYFEKVCKFLKIKINVEDHINKIKSIKLERPEKQEFIEKLKKII